MGPPQRRRGCGVRIMNCETAKETLVELIYQEEGVEISPDFKAHFAKCHLCAAEYLELLSTKQVLGDWTDEEPPSTLVFAQAAAPKPGWRSSLPAWQLQ